MMYQFTPIHYVFYNARLRRKKWLALLNNEDVQKQPLTDLLDDRPPDVFLNTLSEKWDFEEKKIFETLKLHELKRFEEISELWGKKTAQRQILIKDFKTIPHENSLMGLLEILRVIMFGGNFLHSPLILRRYTDKILEYETPPHSHPLTCHLESFVFKGFAEAFALNVEYQRRCFSSYCMDSYTLYDTTNQYCA